jgi:hypothetical protein
MDTNQHSSFSTTHDFKVDHHDDAPPNNDFTSSSSLLTEFNADVVLNVIQYLNVVDSNRLAITSKRFFYLVHQYRTIRGPELVTVASWHTNSNDATTRGGRGGPDNRSDMSCSTTNNKRTRRASDAPNNVKGEQYSQEEVIQQAIHGLQSSPNLVLSFTQPLYWRRIQRVLDNRIPVSFPDDAVLLGASAPAIQVNHPVLVSSVLEQQSSTHIEHKSVLSLMACNFPGAVILPFHLETINQAGIDFLQCRMDRARERNVVPVCHKEGGSTTPSTPSNSDSNTKTTPDSFWKAIIVYACGDCSSDADYFISAIQELVPIVVGGICNDGFVSQSRYDKDDLNVMSIRQLRYLVRQYHLGDDTIASTFVEKSALVQYLVDRMLEQAPSAITELHDGIFGVVLGGDAPVRSIVSRGVSSILQPHGKPQNRSNLVVHRSATLHPSDEGYMFRSTNESTLRPAHLIYELLDTDTGAVLSFENILQREIDYGQYADFIGLKRRDGAGHIHDNNTNDGFELFAMDRYSGQLGAFVIMTDGSPHESQELGVDETQVDLFCLDGEACLQDMDLTVAKLQAQTVGEEILGAIMISCSGRGPGAGRLIKEVMADATRFHHGFPSVPCLGFYAGGEIGPVALAGNDTVFRSGRAAVQGVSYR